MGRLRRLAALEARERRLLVVTAAALVGAQLALDVLPFAHVRRATDRLGRPSADEPDEDAVERVAWAVRTAAMNLPTRPSCLARALVGQLLLRRAGHDATIALGVKPEDEALRAHGWVELDGEAVVGRAHPDSGFERLGALEDR